ncbi:MAG: glycoside hydrolase family 3 N-terminal domain-containing protein [Steroidobacteraceae bacterium]
MSRIEQLIDRMTLEEKLGQLTMTACGYAVTGPVIAGDSTDAIRAGAIGNLLNLAGAKPIHEMQRMAVEQSRLKIPLLVGLDVIHGYRTLFPIPLAEAASFDDEAWTASAREAAREAAADGLHMTFAPMLDVSRDPRWGRTAEGPGEDAWLGARIARAKVIGFQGRQLSAPDSIAAVAKHFVAYGPVTAGREYASVDISERTLREVHLPPFVAAVEAGVVAVMPAFTDLAGIPMTMHKPLLRDCLREQLGFGGVLVSDYNAIGELLKHGVATDLAEAAALAIRAGVDIDMMSDAYRRGLPIALERGLVVVPEIDECVWRVLRLKERLGLFEDPFSRGAQPESATTLAQRRQLARSIAARSIVLLKNQAEALPLHTSVRKLALIGPLADAPAEMRGPWWAAGQPDEQISLLAGLRNALPQAEIRYAAGVAIEGDDTRDIAPALALCEGVDAILLCLGEAATMSGEAASRADPSLPGQQNALAQAVIEHAHARGIATVAILFSGRPLMISWLAANAHAVLAAWFLGNESGNAIADVLLGRVSPSGRTPISWPRAIGQVPVFFAQRPSGRPADARDHFTSRYLDLPNDPLYPFGHGLTYGRCRLANLRVTPAVVTQHDVITVEVEVSNEGRHAADETVFLFAHDKIASVARPLLELKGFTRISLQPGQSGTARIALPASDLRFLDLELRPTFEPGEVELLVGPCADRSQLLVAQIQLRA